jgi:hypothetical protein
MELPSLKLPAVAAVALCFAVAGVAAGWYMKPDVVRVEEKVRVVEVTKEVVVAQEKVRVEIVRVKDTAVVEAYRKEKTTSPDGTIKEVEERNINTVVKENTTQTEVKVVKVEVEKLVDRVVDRVVRVEPVLAQWHAGILAGAAPRFDTPALTAVMGGVEVERRVAGPFWVGAWVMGGSPVQQFQLTNAAIGIKLGVEF